jgi:hypothetical protein
VPRISAFFGIVIEMHYGDHPPPHFHGRHGGESAQVAILTGAVLGGSLSPRALKLVREWTAEHRDELERNFLRVVDHVKPDPIEPLK